ncbi:MAG: hypothetical protein AB1668_03160 [Nanoarchaeota archaeon]
MKDDILLELYDYCGKRYSQKEMEEFMRKFEKEFPYPIEDIDPQNFIRNYMDWLVLEKVLPATGKRITESYVEEHQELNEEIKQKILNTKNVIVSKFVVISKEGLNLKLKSMLNGNYYNVVQISNNPQIQANTIILGRIFPWGQIYRFAGAMLLMHTPMIVDPDIMMHMYEKKEKERAESLILSPSTKLTAILNKYPFQWVDGICNALSLGTSGRKNDKARDIFDKVTNDMPKIIHELPEKSKEVLKLLLQSGGSVKYNLLKDYDDEITWWWNSNPPKSTIGRLRVHGLIVVGRMPQSSKFYKVAMIPKDLQEKISLVLKP